jgi:hypothetical protein
MAGARICQIPRCTSWASPSALVTDYASRITHHASPVPYPVCWKYFIHFSRKRVHLSGWVGR